MAQSVFSNPTARPVPTDAKPAGFQAADGTLALAQLDGSGNLKVAVTGAGSGGTSSVDEAAFTAGVSAGTPAMGVYEATPSTLTDGQLGILALDEDRNVKVNVVAGSGSNPAAGTTGDPVPASSSLTGFEDSTGDLVTVKWATLDYDTGAGTYGVTGVGILLPASGGPVAGGTSSNPLRVDPTGTTTQPVSDAGGSITVDGTVAVTQGTASNLNATVVGTGTFAVQAAQSGTWNITDISGTVSLPTGAATAAKQPALGTAGSASADVITVQGITSMTPIQIADNGGAITVDNGGTFAVQATAVGTVADDATTPGAPVMVGGSAKSPDGTDPGSVSAENDVARAITDLNRRVFVNTHHPRQLHKHLNGSTAYTDESIAADPGDGFQIVITSIIASTGAATALNFFLEEGSTTIFGPIYLEAVAGRGFASGPIYLPVTASEAVTLTSSASIAQSFDIDYFIQAV